MSLRIKRRLLHRFARLRNLRISTKLTLIYAAILCSILLFTSFMTVAGLYFVLYHQAGIEMEISTRQTLSCLDLGNTFDSEAFRDDVLMPGVILRVTDESGRIIFDNAAHFPPLWEVERHVEKNPPFWAHPGLQVVNMHNLRLYYEKVSIVYNGKNCEMHFLKTITAENNFLSMLERSLMVTNLIGLLVALLAGYFISRRILRPIRTLTQAAREIEITDLDRRIEVSPARDELSELADTFNHMLDRIQSGFEQQRRFVSDASHELRTPVTVIRGYSDMLSRWGREDKAALDEGIAAIRSEAEDMQELIEKLLFLARADQKRQVLHKERLNLEELVQDVARKAQIVDKTHEVSLLQNDAAEVFADSVTIKQMLRIFLENSMKYTPAGGHIRISSVRQAAFMQIEIADDGIGIAPEHQQKVFARFYRVDSSRTKAQGGVGGTGLGLSIASWIAERHDIAISLESVLGHGTKIVLKVPVL